MNNNHGKYLTITERLKLVKDIQDGKYLIKDQYGKIYEETDKTLYSNKCSLIDVLEKLADIKEIGTGSYGKASLICTPKGDCESQEYTLAYSIKEVVFQNLGTYNTLIHNPDRYENVEIRMLQFLSSFVFSHATPHINIPIMSFICEPSAHLSDRQRNELSTKRYIISELANYGNMYGYVRSNLRKWKNNPVVWKVLFFQILSTLAIIHRYYPNFLHNDFKLDNLLVRSTTKDGGGGDHYQYTVNGVTYYIPDVGFQVLMWDFDFSCIAGIIDNDKVIAMIDEDDANLVCHRNQYYDIHMCFGLMNKYWGDSMPDSITDWLNEYLLTDQIPSAERDERILESIEYTTPAALLDNNFFDEFRIQKSGNVLDNFTGKLDTNKKFRFGDKANRYTDPKNCEYQSYMFFDPKYFTQDERIALRNRYKCTFASESPDRVTRISSKQYNKMQRWLENILDGYDVSSSITPKESKDILKNAMILFEQFTSKYYITSGYLYAILCVATLYSSFNFILAYISPFNDFRYWYSLDKLNHLKPGSLEDTYKQFCGFIAKHIEGA